MIDRHKKLKTGASAVFCALTSLVQAQSVALDPSFNPGTGVDRLVYSIALQTNGALLIAGNFTRFNGTARTNVARLNANGTLDTTFDPGPSVGGLDPFVNAVVVQPGGEVLLGGGFTNLVATNLARLNTNGTLDMSFVAQTDDLVNAVVVQTNGSVVIGGFFSHVDGAARSGVARLDVNGNLDSNLAPTLSGDFVAVYALALQSDGKILIGGSFTNVNGHACANIARLNANGSLDTTFTPGAVTGGQLSPAAFYTVAVGGQGRVLAGGDFTTVNGLARTNLVRLDSDGSLDLSFDPAAGTDAAVNSMVVQSDGKVLLGGYFSLVHGVSRNYIARLNADGSLDTGFDPGTGASDVVFAVALQSDAKILLGGGFTTFDGGAAPGIARLQNVVAGPELINPVFSANTFKVSVATQSGRNYSLQYKDSLSDTNWTALPAVAGDGTVQTLVDSSATGPRRFYRVQVQ